MFRLPLKRMFKAPSLWTTKISRPIELSPFYKIDVVNADAFIDEVSPMVYGIVFALDKLLGWEMNIAGKQQVAIDATCELWKSRSRLKIAGAGTFMFVTTLHKLIEFLKEKGVEICERDVAIRVGTILLAAEQGRRENQN